MKNYYILGIVMSCLFVNLITNAQAPTVDVVLGTNNIPITEVKLEYNGTEITQTSGVLSPLTTVAFPVNLIHFKIDDGGIKTIPFYNDQGLKIKNNNFTGSVTGVGVYSNGNTTLASSADWADSMEAAMKNKDLASYMFYDAVSNIPPGNDFDLLWTYGFTKDDYFVVGERFGNTFFTITPLGSNGDTIPGASNVRFGFVNGTSSGNGSDKYDWSIGYAPPSNTNQAFMYTAIDVELFNTDSTIFGIRVDNNGEADVKFFAVSDSTFTNNPVNPNLGGLGGNIFQDQDGASNGINGIRLDSVESTPLYVCLVDNTGLVADATRVNEDGSYAFVDLEAGTYSVYMSTSNCTVGSTPPADPNLPTGWNVVGESRNSSMTDGTPNGIITNIVVDSTFKPENNFGINDGSFPLGVELLNFDVHRVGNQVILSWLISQDGELSKLIIERSSNGYLFKKVGQVSANATAYTDLEVDDKEAYYYRLGLVQYDNSITYSKVQYVRAGGSNKGKLQISPNPVREDLTLLLPQDEATDFYTVKILSLQGNTISNQNMIFSTATSKIKLGQIDKLPKGMYFVQLTGKDNNVYRTKFLKK